MISGQRRIGKTIWTALGAAVILADLSCAGEQAVTGVVARAKQLFDAVENRFDSLQTLQYTVERITRSTRHEKQERWVFRYRQPGDVRIDYQFPEDRMIIITSTQLIEYLPGAHAAMRTDLTRLQPADKAQRIGGVLARVSVEGLRVGDATAMLDRVQRVEADTQQAGAMWVEGTGPRFRIQVDPTRRVVLSMELWDEHGAVRLRTTAADFVESAPGQWFPQRIDTVYGTAEGTISSEVHLRNIKLNEPLIAATFEFAPDQRVKVQEH